MSENRLSASVVLEKTTYAFDGMFDYLIPDGMRETLRVGARVVVPFGKGNKRRVGLVMSIRDADSSAKLKELCAVVDDSPVLSEELVRLCGWMRDNTFCTYFDAFRAMLPPGLGYTLSTRYAVNEEYTGELSEEEQTLCNEMKALSGKKLEDYINDEVAANGIKRIKSLVAKGAVTESDALKRRVGDDTMRMLRLTGSDSEKKLTAKQRAVVSFLEECESASVSEVCYSCTVTPAVTKRLVSDGVLEEYQYQVFRTEPAELASESPDDIILSEKQGEVYDGLCELMDSPEPKCALLRGVTGSGKTSVFIKLIAKALRAGKSAVMLVPEISLTPQMVGKFRRLFGAEVAIMHSSLSLGERADEYQRIKCGKARIVIGTRSAVFAPVQDLGIIVIDEEGESTYKSESSPRYHARDIAKQRCFANNAFLLLASATPSLDSYYYAKTGRYSLFELEERYNQSALPEVYMVDMREEVDPGNEGSFSEPLITAVRENLERGEQSILLLNRRGYHTSVRCAACGAAAECPNCSLPMTYHKANGTVICHYCGFMKRLDRVCIKCGSRFFEMKGTGTQRIEDEISALFPSARVLRMDADTTVSKNAFEDKFRAFGNGEYDIIVGTQMIAKGLDFPNVTLVGVLKTDNSLYAGDFKAHERTFSLITQVVGRGGRGDKTGRAFLQTFSPEHYVLCLAATQDYIRFYEQEIELREALLFPPFCDIVTVSFTSLDDKRCEAAARRFRAMLEERKQRLSVKIPLDILGPAKYAIGKINGRYRYRLVIKCRNSSHLRTLISESLRAAYGEPVFKGVSFYADMNSESF